MKERKFLSIIMAVFMVISLLPSMVFAAAAPAGGLDGKLKIKGTAAVGSTLSADYTKVTPEGLTDDYVSFQWSRQVDENTELTEVGTDKTYEITSDDLGCKIILQVTGLEDMGVTGSLKASTAAVAATPEEAQPAEDTDAEEAVSEVYEEIPAEELPEEVNQEEIPAEEQSDWEELEEVLPEETSAEEESQDEEILEEVLPQTADEDTIEEMTEGIPDAEDDMQEDAAPEEMLNEEELQAAADAIPEATEDPQEELTYTAEIVTEDGSGVLEFGTLVSGYEDMDTFYVTIRNTGTGELNFDSISPEHFMVEDVEGTLLPGEEKTLWIQPRENLEPGEYADIITYSSAEGAEASFEARVAVTEETEELEETEEPADDTEQEEAPDGEDTEMVESKAPETEETVAAGAAEEPGTEALLGAGEVLEVSLAELDFGSAEEGYTQPAAQTFTVKNIGTESVTFLMPSASYYDMETEDSTTLDSGDSATFTVQPKLELGTGIYNEAVGISLADAAEPETSITLKFEVTAASAPAPVVSLEASPLMLDFGSETEGYTEAPEAKTVTVTNTGTDVIKLTQPTAVNYEIGTLSATELAAGESATFTVQPKTGLAVADAGYDEDISIIPEGAADAAATVSASFMVTAKPTVQLTVSPDTITFDSAEEGYTEAPEAQTFTVTNDGTDTVTLSMPGAIDYFDLSTVTETVLDPGESAAFTVQPKTGLAAGTYNKTINVAPEGATAEVSVSFTVTEPAPVYKLSVKPQSLDFGKAEAGYGSAPDAQTVTVTNNGNARVQLKKDSSDFFTVGDYSAVILDAGESATFTVQPVLNLAEGLYSDTIDITTEQGASASVTASFIVTDETIRLTGIQTPEAITGLANGVEKSTEGLKLPSTVVITTSNGKMKAGVTWDVKNCAYDRNNTAAQNFSVKGTVTLPDGVENPDNISLITSVKVTVNAYSAKAAQAADNKITGISSDEHYTTQSKIAFTAVGAGMDNDSPRAGDTRYEPVQWKVINTITWDGAPYTGAFGMSKSGNYTLTVTFEPQTYDGSAWKSTGGDNDTKSVNFTVYAAAAVTATPTPAVTGATAKAAVKTGDDTNIWPFIIILIVAAGCIAGVVIYRKKKK